MAVTPFKERVECALPAAMMYAIMTLDVFVVVDKEKGLAEKERTKALLKKASLEPLDGLPVKVQIVVAKQIDRVHDAVTKEFDGQKADKVAAAIYYFLKEITDSGYLELWEGSAVAEAAASFLTMIEHVFDNEKLDQSAQKQARRLLSKLNQRGYYV